MTQHTPGPWFANLSEETVTGADGNTVVYELNTNEADARLIASAPDLLEALQDLFGADMEHVLMGDGKDDQIEAIAKARAAIAKATGEKNGN
jgi:hypothetical protein